MDLAFGDVWWGGGGDFGSGGGGGEEEEGMEMEKEKEKGGQLKMISITGSAERGFCTGCGSTLTMRLVVSDIFPYTLS